MCNYCPGSNAKLQPLKCRSVDTAVVSILILGAQDTTAQVSAHVALDHQTYAALAQHTQITRTAQLTYNKHYRVQRWR